MFELSVFNEILKKAPEILVIEYDGQEYCIPKHRDLRNHVVMDEKSVMTKVLLILFKLSVRNIDQEQLQDITFHKINETLPVYKLNITEEIQMMNGGTELVKKLERGPEKIQVKKVIVRPKSLELELYVSNYTFK